MKNNIKLYLGDSKEVLKKLEPNSIDTVITDPPYGLSFMGKKWDYDVPSVELWKEVLRVLKPGGTALIFAGSRTQHRMAINVEDAGFILKDCIMWLYGTGFPKATDISKQLDKGVDRKVIGKGQSGAKESHNSSLNMSQIDNNTFGGEYNITEPTTEEAKIWSGYKSHGLKPAYEPILVAMKPNEGTYAQNALKYGVSGLNIDGGRIPLQEKGEDKRLGGGGSWKTDKCAKNVYEGGYEGKNIKSSQQGRFPANIILDEEASRMLDEQSGVLTSGKMNSITKGHDSETFNTYGKQYVRQVKASGDKGGASRFFYCAKASKAERNMGCEGLEKKQTTGGGGGIGDYKDDVNSMSGKYGSEKAPAKNHHPTVKPLKLMEYLCTLTKTPTGGIVLDPFMGSGTTGMAVKITGRKFIGIELSEEYMKIAMNRIKVVDDE